MMRELTIYNPTAGKGKSPVAQDVYKTVSPGDARNFIKNACVEDQNTHFFICGGDGTLNEAVCGVMDAAAGEHALLTAVPCGSGNDTVKSFPRDRGGCIEKLDVIALNDRYGINMINIGFDCNVVKSASMFKKRFRIAGKLSYILGVITEFFKPFGEKFTIEAELEDGTSYFYSGEILLCAVCNGQWCGGSFHNSPYSDMTDGVLELVLVKKTGRLNFLKMVGKYQKGTLIGENGRINPERFTDLVSCQRVKKVKVSGIKRACTDGEVEEMTAAEISVLPSAVRFLYR